MTAPLASYPGILQFTTTWFPEPSAWLALVMTPTRLRPNVNPESLMQTQRPFFGASKEERYLSTVFSRFSWSVAAADAQVTNPKTMATIAMQTRIGHLRTPS